MTQTFSLANLRLFSGFAMLFNIDFIRKLP